MEVYRNVHLRCAKKVAPRRVRREECAAVRMDARVPGGFSRVDGRPAAQIID